MNCLEYAATKIMGWVLVADHFACGCADYMSYCPRGGCKEGPAYFVNGECHKWAHEWHPDTDRNQLWLVLEKLSDELLDDLTETGFAVDEGLVDFHAGCMAYPPLALEAICKAHQAQEGG